MTTAPTNSTTTKDRAEFVGAIGRDAYVRLMTRVGMTPPYPDGQPYPDHNSRDATMPAVPEGTGMGLPKSWGSLAACTAEIPFLGSGAVYLAF